MLDRFRLRTRSLLRAGRVEEAAPTGAALDALRALLIPRSVEVRGALRRLNEDLEAVDWCTRHVAATHDPALARVFATLLDGERARACLALEELRGVDPTYTASLCRLLFRNHLAGGEPALGRGLAAVRTVLTRTIRWRETRDESPRVKRYGT